MGERKVGYRYTATPDNIDDIDIGKNFTNNDFVINETLDIGTFSNIGLVINDNLDIGNFFQYRVRWGLLVRLGYRRDRPSSLDGPHSLAGA